MFQVVGAADAGANDGACVDMVGLKVGTKEFGARVDSIGYADTSGALDGYKLGSRVGEFEIVGSTLVPIVGLMVGAVRVGAVIAVITCPVGAPPVSIEARITTPLITIGGAYANPDTCT